MLRFAVKSAQVDYGHLGKWGRNFPFAVPGQGEI